MEIISREKGVKYKINDSKLILFYDNEKINEYDLKKFCSSKHKIYENIEKILYKRDCLLIFLNYDILYVNNENIKLIDCFSKLYFSYFDSKEYIIGKLNYTFPDIKSEEDNFMIVKYILQKNETNIQEYILFNGKNMNSKECECFEEEESGAKFEIFHTDENMRNFLSIFYFQPTFYYIYHSKKNYEESKNKTKLFLENMSEKYDMNINYYKLSIFREDDERIDLKFEFLYPMINEDNSSEDFVKFYFMKENGILIEEYFHEESYFIILRYKEEDFKIRHKILLKTYYYESDRQAKEKEIMEIRFKTIDGDKTIFFDKRNADEPVDPDLRFSILKHTEYFENKEFLCIVLYNNMCSYSKLFILNKTFDKTKSLIFDPNWKVKKFEVNKIYFDKGTIKFKI